MKKIIVLIAALALSGCAQWNQLSEGEKVGIVVGTSILIGASIIKNSQDPDINKVCVSTRSIETGCGNARL